MAQFDVLIIGAGAAGLMAAAAAAGSGQNCLLLEKNRKLGVKILMSGGTRCNITHNCSPREIVSAYGRQGKFLHSALAALPPEAVIAKIQSQGVATKVESTGKIFPVSNRAIDVRDALVALAVDAGATIANQSPVRSLSFVPERNPDAAGHFQVETDDSSFTASRVIVTTGGLSYPGCGTTGDGYSWARSFGHSIVPTVPALVPILSRCQWANDLKGITIPDVGVRVWQSADLTRQLALAPNNADTDQAKAGKPIKTKSKIKAKVLADRQGSFLFTHWGFSGPSVLDVSRAVANHDRKSELELICDFLPAVTTDKLLTDLKAKKQASVKQNVAGLLGDYFPKRFGESLIAAGEVSPESKNADLSNQQLQRIVDRVKQCHFAINGTLGFEKAEVTAGGVNLNEISSKTMESKRQPGLYFAGEVLNLDGPIGGFNFQAAFSTGWLAGSDTSIIEK